MSVQICNECKGRGTPTCVHCKNTGKQARCACGGVPCRECHGEGVLECDLGHDHDCRECDGRGTVTKCGDRDCELGWIPDSPQVAADVERRTCAECHGDCKKCKGRGVVRVSVPA